MNRKGPIFSLASWGGILGDETGRLYLAPPLLRSFGLRPGCRILLKLGQKQTPVWVDIVRSNDSGADAVVFVSPDLATICQVPPGHHLTLKYTREPAFLAVGPFIGLFSVRGRFPDSLYGTQEPVLAALAGTSAALGALVFVFCAEDLNWEQALVTGHIPVQDPAGGSLTWTPLVLPFPDVIYDRIPTRSLEALPEIRSCKAGLVSDFAIPWFNPRFLDKWETHLLLENHPQVARYLPPTRLVETIDDIHEFLFRYQAVFLKPSAGSLGRRIIHLRTNPDGTLSYKYRSRYKDTREGTLPDLSGLTRLLHAMMGERRYVVQQDLGLARYADSPIDIRALAQKDQNGNWRRTKIYVRRAAPGSFLSNLSDGGEPLPIGQVLAEVFGEDFQSKSGLGERIRTAVRLIPQTLEEATGQIWGELGIDLGLDQWGHVWLIEINSKPFRTLVSKSGGLKTIERSLMRPLDFAKNLAGFTGPFYHR